MFVDLVKRHLVRDVLYSFLFATSLFKQPRNLMMYHILQLSPEKCPQALWVIVPSIRLYKRPLIAQSQQLQPRLV